MATEVVLRFVEPGEWVRLAIEGEEGNLGWPVGLVVAIERAASTSVEGAVEITTSPTEVTSDVGELAAGKALHAAVSVVTRPAVIEAASIARVVVVRFAIVVATPAARVVTTRAVIAVAARAAPVVIASAAAVKVAVEVARIEAARESIAVLQRLVAECGSRAVARGIERIAHGVVLGPVIFARVLAGVGLAYLHARKASIMGVEAIVDAGELA